MLIFYKHLRSPIQSLETNFGMAFLSVLINQARHGLYIDAYFDILLAQWFLFRLRRSFILKTFLKGIDSASDKL